jgi:two-component system chemotaxis sensor kinase CheA
MTPIDDISSFLATFFEEAHELLDDLEQQLLILESSPDDPELLNTIFRCAHSIKGGSATLGLTTIAQFTHGLETLLDRVRKGQIPVDRTIVEILLASLDHMRALVAVAQGEMDKAPDSTVLSSRIEAATNAVSTAEAVPAKPVAVSPGIKVDTAPADKYMLSIVPGVNILQQGADPILLISKLDRFVTVDSVTCDAKNLPSITDINPEECYLSWNIILSGEVDTERVIDLFSFIADESIITCTPIRDTIQSPTLTSANVSDVVNTVIATSEAALSVTASPLLPIVETTVPAVKAQPESRSNTKSEPATLRVTTDKIDKLINLVGELVINQSMLNEVIQDFTMAKMPALLQAVAQMERNSREMQDRVMAIRMLPIKNAFGRFPRLVRDFSASIGKHIELKTIGEETELDKTVIDLIVDPLTHLVRNSIDHGIETPDVREAAGKSPTGTITLNAFHEGGSIVVEVTDDGKGLNREIILKKAIDRGIIADGDVLSNDAIDNLIFLPGFSTAKEVTDISGRGVGMDIVKRSVLSLGGSISLTSVSGHGTKFRIRLPLTMAILEGLSVLVGKETYILPLTSIIESIQPKRDALCLVAGKAEVVTVRGEILPILRLHKLFTIETPVIDPTKGILVIVEHDEKHAALFVDELIGQSQVVIKSLDDNYQKVDGIAGATIMGDGRVAFILDVASLVHGTDRSITSKAMAA